MYWQNCGSETTNGACQNCGFVPKSKHEIKSGKPFSIVCLATGIASVVSFFIGYGTFIGIAAGIVSLVMGNLYKNRAGQENDMVKTGKILGIVGVALNVAFTLIAVALAVIIWLIYFVFMIAGITMSY